MKAAKAFDRDLVRTRIAALTMGVLYPVWYFVLQICFPNTYDPFAARVSISLFGFLIYGLSHSKTFPRKWVLRLYISTSFICLLHMAWIATQNGWRSDHQLLYAVTVLSFAGVVLSEIHFYTYCVFALIMTPAFMQFGGASTMSIIVLDLCIATPFFALWIFVRSSFTAEQTLSAQAIQVSNNSRFAALGELSSSIAHEINNPLAIIQGKAALAIRALDKNPNPENAAELRKHLESIERSVERTAKIVRSLRILARSGVGDPIVPVPWSRIWETTLELCNERFLKSGIALTQIGDFVGDIPCREAQIVQILVNLLNNAHDAVLTSREKWVRVELRQLRSTIEIRIVDSGPGIAPEHRAKIMTPFFTTKASGQGTGLGLSLSQTLAREHGGTLTMDLAAKNTTFVLLISTAQSLAA